MELRKGTKVRVTYEGTVCDVIGHGDGAPQLVNVQSNDLTVWRVPADATIEPIEDLHEDDIVLDQKGNWLKRWEGGWREFGCTSDYPDDMARRPFVAHFRDGHVLGEER